MKILKNKIIFIGIILFILLGLVLFFYSSFSSKMAEKTGQVDSSIYYPENQVSQEFGDKILRVRQLVLEGKLSEAKNFSDEVERQSKTAPEKAMTANIQGYISEQENNFSQAEHYYKQAVLFYPNFSYAHMNLALVNINEKKFTDALANAEKAVSYTPSEAPVHAVYALALFNNNQKERALKEINKALEIDPKNEKWKDIRQSIQKE